MFCNVFFFLALLCLGALVVFVDRGMAQGPGQTGSPTISLEQMASILRDPDGVFELEDARAAWQRGEFQQLQRSLSLGYTRDVVWLHLAVQRDMPAWLWMEPAYLDDVRIYSYRADGWNLIHTGDNRPSDQVNPIPPPGVIKLDPATLQVPDVFIRIETSGSLNFRGLLLDESAMLKRFQWYTLAYSTALAILLMAFFTNLLLAWRLRDFIHLLYGVYLGITLSGHLAISGLLQLLTPEWYHLLADGAAALLNGLGVSVFCLFAMRLFDTGKLSPWSHRYLQASALFGVVVFMAFELPFYGTLLSVHFINGLFLSFFLLFIAWRARQAGQMLANLYLVAFSPGSLGAAVTFLMLIGVAPTNLLTAHAILLGTLLHVILMNLALTERVTHAEKRALAMSRQAEDHARRLAERMTRNLSHRLEREQQEKAEKGQQLEMLAHEYRTPLAIMRANVDIMTLQDLPEVTREALVKMQRSIVRLEDAVQAFQTQNGDALIMLPINLQTLLSSIRQETQDLWSTRLDWQTQLIDDVHIKAEPDLLKAALFNVIENAFKYRLQGTPVKLSARQDQSWVYLQVSNQAPPRVKLSETELKSLCQKHYRSQNAAHTSGTGIGLYLVRQIVEQHGGDILFDFSDSRFSVTISLPPIGPAIEEQL